MKNSLKSNSISNKLFSFFTNTAMNSSSQCNEIIWQQAKIPKCLLERTIMENKKQN